MESEDDDETGGAELRSKSQEPDGENISGYYEVYETNTLQFRLVIKFIATGITFRQCSKLLYETKQEAKIGEVGNISDGKVISYVRIVCAVNRQRISQILHAVWAFSITFDLCNQGRPRVFRCSLALCP
ncbi:hypothetical protein PsorP6_015260 [Peronosclerospora sorghi]|uniref:Uncharacterized protein n=1 Tax=Peronosclerospora sorghi TaxID=230839 RepID=A0ACC0VUH8_9STRA|nr:hypothetical protein PsorP6_015260 [Peronosclerospora sorghi]